jgi:hypothetical protein
MLTVLLGLVLVGVVLYLVETYIPMSPPIRTVLRVVVVIFLILWLVQIFGLDAGLPRLR